MTTTTTRPVFKVGDLVVDKRDKAKTVAKITGGATHTNGSRKWWLTYPDMTIAVWEVDVRHAEPNK